MTEAILAILLSLPQHGSDAGEALEARAARMRVVAEAISGAAEGATCERDRDPECVPSWRGTSLDLAALLVAVGWHESAFARRVHAGACLAAECDRGRARSPWQLHRSRLAPEWPRMADASPEATDLAAIAAARVLASGVARCGSISGALASYATGGRCSWSGAAARLRTFRRVRARLSEVAK